jgi:hypothetical protein
LFALIASCSQKDGNESKANGQPDSPAAAEDHPLTVEAYLRLGLPSPDRMWTPEDYAQAVRVLNEANCSKRPARTSTLQKSKLLEIV